MVITKELESKISQSQAKTKKLVLVSKLRREEMKINKKDGKFRGGEKNCG